MMGNFREEGFAGVGFPRGVGAWKSLDLGKAVVRRVEMESIMMRLVFGGGKVEVGRERKARRWERVGV